MDRHIIHLHIPSFPIAVARAIRPELRGRPVAVAPLYSERALILSVSAEARQEGLFKGMPLGKAMKFCPGLTVLPPDHDLTTKACQVLAGVVARYTPLWEPSQPGHVYLDVTGTDRLWGRAKDAAKRLRREIKEQAHLSGTVGVASNKMVSSIASQIIRSEGVLDVDHGREPSFMAPLKVDVLPGIGPVRRRILLEELNITLVRQIVAFDMGSLKLVFGQQAYVIHQRALGIDPTPVFPPSTEPTVAEEVTLPRMRTMTRNCSGFSTGWLKSVPTSFEPGTSSLEKQGSSSGIRIRKRSPAMCRFPNPVSGILICTRLSKLCSSRPVRAV